MSSSAQQQQQRLPQPPPSQQQQQQQQQNQEYYGPNRAEMLQRIATLKATVRAESAEINRLLAALMRKMQDKWVSETTLWMLKDELKYWDNPPDPDADDILPYLTG